MQEIKRKTSGHTLGAIRRIFSSRSGDTLVEVMASIVIFLLMMGILQGAVAYSGRALIKNQEIRKENSKILEEISKATPTKASGTDTVSQTFRATNSNLTAIGNDVFTVKTDLYQLQTDEVTFAVYGSPASKEAEGAGSVSGAEEETLDGGEGA